MVEGSVTIIATLLTADGRSCLPSLDLTCWSAGREERRDSARICFLSESKGAGEGGGTLVRACERKGTCVLDVLLARASNTCAELEDNMGGEGAGAERSRSRRIPPLSTLLISALT